MVSSNPCPVLFPLTRGLETGKGTAHVHLQNTAPPNPTKTSQTFPTQNQKTTTNWCTTAPRLFLSGNRKSCGWPSSGSMRFVHVNCLNEWRSASCNDRQPIFSSVRLARLWFACGDEYFGFTEEAFSAWF